MLKSKYLQSRNYPSVLRTTSYILGVLIFCCLFVSAQTSASDSALSEKARQLADQHQWQGIVLLLGPHTPRSADMNFYYGTALARLDRWPEAEDAFNAGFRAAPNDPRFPIELAGSAFRQKHYPQATRRLRQAVKLAPQDRYANDFLGTVYFLEGNLDASLKYWNRVGKPQIVEVLKEPVPRTSPALLDRAFAFSPAGTLQLSELLATEARVRSLGVFSRSQFDLRARDADKFDVLFRDQERNGFGGSKWEALFLILRGAPFSSINADYYNLHHQAINLASFYRWDAQKRRVHAQFSSPFEHSARYRFELATDLRGEDWAIVHSFEGPAPVLASLNLRREALEFRLDAVGSEKLQWSTGAELSHRDFRSVVPGSVLTPELLRKGYQLKQQARLAATLFQLPERRFTIEAEASSQAARLWSQSPTSFEKLQGSVRWHWLPRAQGDDYESQQQFRAGKTFGTPPFDELFMLGLERDTDLHMRAHIGSRDGRKGSAPLGRNYFLANWEIDKDIYSNGVVAVKAGPLLDSGTITDPLSGLGSHEWLWDLGAQPKLRVFGVGVAFSYGKDLRTGNDAFYVSWLK